MKALAGRGVRGRGMDELGGVGEIEDVDVTGKVLVQKGWNKVGGDSQRK